MNWWNEFKEQYELGSVIEITVDKKVPPAFVMFTITDKIKGSLHISELNWNFGLCQEDYKNISVGDTLQVYIIEYDDKFKRVHLGRKLLFTDSKPSLTQEWANLMLKEEYTAVVYEEFRNKVIVRLESGLFCAIPRTEGKSYQLGEKITVIPIGKNSDQNIIDCTLYEFSDSTSEQGEKVIESFKESVSSNDFLSSDTHLNSFQQLSSSFYWNYFSEEEQKVIERLFDNTKNLYSKVDKGEEAIYFEFDFASNAYSDFITIIAPTIFDTRNLPEGFTNKDLFVELSKLNFWYTQYERPRRIEGIEQDITEKFFSLFNETVSIFGIATEEGQLKIRNIKAKIKSESWKEKLKALKHNDIFFISRPIVFSQFSPLDNFNKQFIYNIDNKVFAFRIYEVAKNKSLDIIHEQGKDFKIFSNYLESQIDYEVKAANNSEVQLKECKIEMDIQTDGISFIGKSTGKCDLCLEDKVVISNRTDEGRPQSIGSGMVISIKEGIIKIQSTIDNFELLQKGCYVKRISSTRQHTVQLEVLNQFFTNRLPLETFYKIFHDKEGIEPPLEVKLKYFNEIFCNKDNPQTRAINKAVGNKNIVLIQGPPGTGKTTVITEIVKQLVSQGEKVLVTSQTHIAVDNVLERIKDDAKIRIVRIGHQETISDSSVEYLMEESRKRFSSMIQGGIDLKIDLLRCIQNGNSIEELLSHPDNQKYKSGFENIREFQDYIDSLDFQQIPKMIHLIESWKTVISKTPKLLTDIFLRNVDVVFGTCIGIATCREVTASELCFDTVILDEAGKANISETLTAISKARKIVLVGDHKQLPPYFDSERIEYFKMYAKENKEEKVSDSEIKHALGISFFEYLQKDGILKEENKIMLSEQFRMHPDIGNFISQTFYDSELKNAEITKSNFIRMPEPFNGQIIFIDTSSDVGSSESFKDGSYFNQVEAEFIINKIIPEFKRNNISPQTYAIVTPYSKQSERIKELLLEKDSHVLKLVEVATLDSFQGKEYDIIIFSFTRSSVDKRVGFLDDARRLNVALSRAKKKLILIGNATTLGSKKSHYDIYYTELFKNLLRHAGKYGKVYKINQLDYKKLQSNFKVGDILKGNVKRFDIYGVLVNLGNGHGLIPNEELSWHPVNNSSEILELHQEIDVKVIRINDRGILLSLRQAISEPSLVSTAGNPINSRNKRGDNLKSFENEFKVNDVCEGVISKIVENTSVSLKIFVELKYGIQGMFYTYAENNRLKTGYPVKVSITKIDRERQTVRCKLKL